MKVMRLLHRCAAPGIFRPPGRAWINAAGESAEEPDMHRSADRSRRRVVLGGALALLCTGGLPGPARARPVPETLKLLCGSPPGSVPDVIARRIAEQLNGRGGRTAVVENRSGAAGQIAIDVLRVAPRDGGTLLVGPGAYSTVYPLVYPRLGYDPDRDLLPLTVAAETALAVAVGPAVPPSVRTLAEFVDWARANPSAASWASPGSGTLPHLAGTLLARSAGLSMTHVAFRGGPPAIADAVGGQIAAVWLPEGLLQPQHAAARLRVLATTGEARSTLLPDVRTFAEQGMPELAIREWFAVYLPGGVPPEIAAGVSALIRDALGRPALAAALAPSGLYVVGSGPEQVAARIAAERRRWEPLIRGAGITAEA
jgi:tripartite-type tricarboxylate transporter receptor subunit TctC